jgi:tRNA-dihydrouridine synthase 1
MEPMLKAPGSERLKLKCDVLLLSFAFKFNLRRYSMVKGHIHKMMGPWMAEFTDLRDWLNKVGRCRLTLSKPC